MHFITLGVMSPSQAVATGLIDRSVIPRRCVRTSRQRPTMD